MCHEAWIRYKYKRGIAWDTELWVYPDYPLDYLLEVYGYVVGLLNHTDNKVSPTWSLTVAALAEIVLEENDHAREWEDYPELQAMVERQEQEKRIRAHQNS